MWHFLKFIVEGGGGRGGGGSLGTSVPPSLYRLTFSANEIKLKYNNFNSVKLNTRVVPLCHVEYNMLHMIRVHMCCI